MGNHFSCPQTKTYAVGTQKNRLIETEHLMYPKHMMWVLKRPVTLRRRHRAPKICD